MVDHYRVGRKNPPCTDMLHSVMPTCGALYDRRLQQLQKKAAEARETSPGQGAHSHSGAQRALLCAACRPVRVLHEHVGRVQAFSQSPAQVLACLDVLAVAASDETTSLQACKHTCCTWRTSDRASVSGLLNSGIFYVD